MASNQTELVQVIIDTTVFKRRNLPELMKALVEDVLEGEWADQDMVLIEIRKKENIMIFSMQGDEDAQLKSARAMLYSEEFDYVSKKERERVEGSLRAKCFERRIENKRITQKVVGDFTFVYIDVE